jgi:hypothetical protein
MGRWKMVLAAMVAVAVEVLLSVGTAHAGGPPTTRIHNQGTLVLLTTGFGALAWWMRGRR